MFTDPRYLKLRMPGIENQKPSSEEKALVISKAGKLLESVGFDHYSKVDIDKLQQDEVVEQFWLHTHYLSGNQVDETVEMIEKTFKWRKEFGANEISKESLNPKLLNGPIFAREEVDKDGFRILVFCLRKHVKVAAEAEEMKKVFVSFLEELRKDDPTQRGTIVFDCSGAGLKNVDMDLIKFMVNMLNYYPNMLAKILIFDLPWVLNPVLTVIKALLPGPAAKLIRQVTKSTVADHLTDISWLV